MKEESCCDAWHADGVGGEECPRHCGSCEGRPSCGWPLMIQEVQKEEEEQEEVFLFDEP